MTSADWSSAVLKRLHARSTRADTRLGEALAGQGRIHLAVFVEPYLEYVLAGQKTVESRFSVTRCAPYRRVQEGDLLLLKRSGGPITGLCTVDRVWFYELDAHTLAGIRQQFSAALCAQDPRFWTSRTKACYATLMRVRDVARIPPLLVEKRDRRGWVVLRDTVAQMNLSLVAAVRESHEQRAPAARAASRATTPIPVFGPVAAAVDLLRSNAWHDAWWQRPLDPKSRAQMGQSLEELRVWTRRRLAKALGRTTESRGTRESHDALRTPRSGRIFLYAQRATATCCRRCIRDWFAIPDGRPLSDEELNWLTDVALRYIEDRMKDSDL